MNLQDAREERAHLNNRIQQALDDFTANTGLTVSSIDLDTVVVFGSSQSQKYIINTEVQL